MKTPKAHSLTIHAKLPARISARRFRKDFKNAFGLTLQGFLLAHYEQAKADAADERKRAARGLKPSWSMSIADLDAETRSAIKAAPKRRQVRLLIAA